MDELVLTLHSVTVALQYVKECAYMCTALIQHYNACVHNEKTRPSCKQGFLCLMLCAFLSCMPLDDGVSIDICTHS
jgi:hypothetical protein